MSTITTTYFLQNVFRGEMHRPVYQHASHKHVIALISVALFCPKCGDVWARFHRQSDHTHKMIWTTWRLPCPRHDHGGMLFPDVYYQWMAQQRGTSFAHYPPQALDDDWQARLRANKPVLIHPPS